MKFTNNLKLCFSIFFIYLTFFTEINALKYGLTFNKLRYKSLVKYSIQTNLPFQKPMGNFFYGFTAELAGGDEGFLACFSKDVTSGDETQTPEGQEVTNNMETWRDILSNFLRAAQSVFDFFCKYRLKTVKFLKGVFTISKYYDNFKNRVLLESGDKATGTNMEETSGIFDIKDKLKDIKDSVKDAGRDAKESIKDAGRDAKQSIKDAGSNAKDFIEENITDPVFTSFFNPIKEIFMSFISKLKEFFNSKRGIMSKVKECVTKSFNGAKNIVGVISGLYSKINTLMKTIALSPYAVAVYSIDFIVALLCDYRSFQRGINEFMVGFNEKANKNERFHRFGRSLGIFLRSFATAETFTEAVIGKLV